MHSMEIEEEKSLLGTGGISNRDASVESPIDEKKEDTPDADNKPEKTEERELPIRTRDIGVWRVFYQDTPWGLFPGAETARRLKEVLQALPLLWTFIKDVWTMAPGYLILWGLSSVWEAVEGALSLWVTAQLLQTVSTCLWEWGMEIYPLRQMQSIILSGKSDLKAVRFVFGVKLALGIAQWVHRWLE